MTLASVRIMIALKSLHIFLPFCSTGIELENVRFRPECVDELDLPIKLIKGSIGSLKLQLPFSAVFTSRPLTIEL